jgi:hypothetical protein
MVSKREQRRGSRLPLKLVWSIAVLGSLACSRRAEIENAPDAGEIPVTEVPQPDAGVPPVVDASLQNADGLACADRPVQVACVGVNDFPCAFDAWLQTLAQACQVQTDCHTDGWLEVQIGSDGCASELRMEDPDAAYVACIAEQLSRYQCPCADVVGSRFLGLGHDGCIGASCGTGELRCPPGSTCRREKCVEDGASGGAGGQGG